MGKKKYSIFGRPLITWSRAPEQVFVDDVLFITHPDGMANNYSKVYLLPSLEKKMVSSLSGTLTFLINRKGKK